MNGKCDLRVRLERTLSSMIKEGVLHFLSPYSLLSRVELAYGKLNWER